MNTCIRLRTGSNDEDLEAIYCVFVKQGNSERRSSSRNTLSIPTVYYAEYNDELSVNFDIENAKDGVSVSAVELFVYAADKKGNDIYRGERYSVKYNSRINPGSVVKTGSIRLPKRSQIATIYSGIHKIVFSDGTTKIFDNVDYYQCTYQE